MNQNKHELRLLKLKDADKPNLYFIEAAIINICLIAKFAIITGATLTLTYLKKALALLVKHTVPLYRNAIQKLVFSLGGAYVKCRSFIAFNKLFASRIKEENFFKAIILQLKDIYRAIRRTKGFAKTCVNYLVPIASCIAMVYIISDAVNTDYGISVEYNGKDMGVVSAEIDSTDIEYLSASEVPYVNSNMQIIPLTGTSDVIDEVTLVNNLKSELSRSTSNFSREISDSPENPVAQIDATEEGYHDKVRAYALTVNGELLGGLESTDKIDAYIENQKAKYIVGDVVEAKFDKEIDYSYEKFFAKDELLSEDEVITKFSSIVAEPVFYEVVSGDNPWTVSRKYDMSVDELNNCVTVDKYGDPIADIEDDFPIGAKIQLSEQVPYLQMLVTRKVTYTGSVDYRIVESTDKDLYKGEIVVDTKGVEGEAIYVANITYKNGTPVMNEIISETITEAPKTQYQRIGTRATKTEVSEYGGTGDMFWPVDGGGRISSYFNEYRGNGVYHKGLDIAAPYGTKLYATETGTITKMKNTYNGYGECVIIEHDNGYLSLYAHMSDYADLDVGDRVVKGQLIGYVGSTGDSSGNHVHFEIRKNGYYKDPLDYVGW